MATRDIDDNLGAVTNQAEPTVVGGLPENIAGALSYLLGFLTGFLFFLVEKENRFVRFHAVQSIIVFGGLFVLNVALSVLIPVIGVIPFFGWVAVLVLGLVALLILPIIFVLWLFLMYQAFRGVEYSLPVAGKLAAQYA